MKYALILIIAVSTLTTTAQEKPVVFAPAIYTEKNNSPSIISSESAEYKNMPAELIALNNSAVQNALKGNYQTAINEFRRAISVEPAAAEAVKCNLAITLGYDGQYDEAVRILRDVTADNPEYAKAIAHLGELLYKTGDFAESIEYSRRAIKLNPSDVITMVNLGSSLHQKAEYVEALQWFDRAIKIEPNFAKAINNRGVTLLVSGQIKQAVPAFRRAIAIAHNFAEPYNNLSVALSQTGKKKESLQSALKAVELRPDWSYAVYNLGVGYIENNNRQAAYRQLNVLEKIDAQLATKLKEILWQKFVTPVSS